MRWTPRKSDPRPSPVRRASPGFEPLEGRALLALGSPAYFPGGTEIMDVVYPNSTLYEYDNAGHSTYLGYNVVAASVAIDPHGNKFQDVVFNNGTLYQYDSAGAHYLGNNVLDASVAVGPSGDLIQDVVFNNGTLYQYDSAGAHYLGNNVAGVGATFGLDGQGEIQDVVFNNGTLYEYDSAGGHYLGDNVVSVGMSADLAADGLPGDPYVDAQTRVIAFRSGALNEYDRSGTHFLGQVFPSPYGPGTPRPAPPPLPPLAGLATAYKGVIHDFATDGNGHDASIQPAGSYNIFLSGIQSDSDTAGDNVSGVITVKGWGGDTISTRFVGLYDTGGTTPRLKIRNLDASDPVTFTFDFHLDPDGSLYVTHVKAPPDLYGFSVHDANDGLYDDSASGSNDYVRLIRDPTG
jgi:hypothetical protein